MKDVGGDRYGQTWFRGAYHFLKFNKDGQAQADFYLKTINDAGGFDVGDILPIVDVELGGETNSNQKASAQQIIDCTSAWAERVKKETDQQVMLYGNGATAPRRSSATRRRWWTSARSTSASCCSTR